MDGKQHRWFVLALSILPLAGLVAAMVLLWNIAFRWSDVWALAVMYVVCGLGISMGYHRLFAHRAFASGRVIRVGLATAGAMAGQGPPITWVAHHRKHHRVADRPGDPHSPHLDFPPNLRGMIAGLWHAHLGWLFNERLESDPMRYAPDLVRDKPVRWISVHFLEVVAAGILLGGLIGWAFDHTWVGFLTGLLWGGLVRIFLVNHITYAVNSIGHYFGRRRYATRDESRNVAWLALPSFGEGWHNNHHAFPRSARHGMRWYEVDVTATVIWSLERVHLVRNVIRIDPERMALRERGGTLVRLNAEGGDPQSAVADLEPTAPLAVRRRADERVGALTDVE